VGVPGGIVTLLFTDVVASTDLLDRLGDDGYDTLRRAHFRILREAVAARGGTEVKNLGDGLMVVFATPARAVECAIAIQQGVEKHNREQHDERRMGVRVALHAGEPIQDEADYFGKPVVVAKRLCDQAAGAQIVASSLVRDLVADRRDFLFSELGSLQLKGLTDAVTAVEVGWAPIAERVSAFGTAAHQSPFVGRESELQKLVDALERAGDGERQVVLLGGEAGVGKTRLAAEFTRVAVDDGALLLYGRCSPDPLVAYEPFVEAFSADGVPSFDELRARAGLVRGQREPPERATATESEEFSERYWLFEEVVGAISAAAAVRPVVLVLDDLHWADRPTLLLFRHLGRSMGGPRLVLLGAFREGDPAFDASRRGVVADLYREGAVHRMTLEGLEEAAVLRLVAHRRGEDWDTEALARSLFHHTEGNPFFIEELLHHFEELGLTGRITAKDPFSHVVVPEGVKEVIRNRLSHLDDLTWRVLTAGAVLGHSFTISMASATTGLDEDDVVEALEHAIDARIIVEDRSVPDVVGFSHALVRETLYQDMSTARRARLHERAAEALEASATGEQFAELAHHFLEAAAPGRADKAVTYGVQAAEWAQSQLAYESAVDLYERVLEILGPADAGPHARCRLLLKLGHARHQAGDHRGARAAFAEAAELARTEGSAAALAEAAAGFADWRGFFTDPGPARELLEEAVSALPADEGRHRAQVLAELAYECSMSGLPDRGERLSREAVAVARRVGDGDLLARALRSRHLALTPAVDLAERVAVAEEILDLSRQSGDRVSAFFGRVDRIIDRLEVGDVAGADSDIEQCARLAEELRANLPRWYTVAWAVMRALLDGRLDEAERISWDGLALGRELAVGGALEAFGNWLFYLRREQGRIDELEEASVELVDRHPTFPGFRAGLVFLYASLGRRQEAEDHLAELDAMLFEPDPHDSTLIQILVWLADACAILEDRRRGERVAMHLAPFAGRNAVLGPAVLCSGAISRPLARLAALEGRTDDARRLFEEAITLNTAMGARPWLAHTQHEYARLLLASPAGADHDRARALLEEARRSAAQLGMTALERQLQEVG
jgi:class 3 adenylate cyclase/tetratricopeptide (TPR) repeat protein